MLKPLLEDDAVLKIGQNMKYDAKILARHGIRVAPIDDTMLMSYAMHAGMHGHGMDTLAERYLTHQCIPIKDLIGTGKAQVTFDRVPIEAAVKYGAEDAEVTFRLWHTFKPQLHQNRVTTVYETLERPLVPVLMDMEMAGVKVDRNTLSRMSGAFAQTMARLEEEIHELAGEKFNVGSPKQLGEILFDKMNLPGGQKGKTGAYATGADILEDLAMEHDLPRRILDWRQVSKLKSTYTDALQDHINPETGRVHTSYSIAGANTGRLASTDPNLQNIPVRTEEGRRIREAFVAEPGKVLVSLDYSQIELRILAHMADIRDVQRPPRPDDARHPPSGQGHQLRCDLWHFGLRARPEPPHPAGRGAGLHRPLLRTLPRHPRLHGPDGEVFVQTMFGRRVNTPDINAKGPTAGFARRAAINAPIQGTAADIIRRAMIRMPAAIAGMPAKMLLQVHDELLFEVDEDAADRLIAVARDVMEEAAEPAVKLTVPLVVDAGKGANWAAAH